MKEFAIPTPPNKRREAVKSALDMTMAQFEAGNIEAIAIVYVGPLLPDDTTDVGIRYLVGAQHIDFVEDGFKHMVSKLEEMHGVTTEELRRVRARGVKDGNG